MPCLNGMGVTLGKCYELEQVEDMILYDMNLLTSSSTK